MASIYSLPLRLVTTARYRTRLLGHDSLNEMLAHANHNDVKDEKILWYRKTITYSIISTWNFCVVREFTSYREYFWTRSRSSNRHEKSNWRSCIINLINSFLIGLSWIRPFRFVTLFYTTCQQVYIIEPTTILFFFYLSSMHMLLANSWILYKSRSFYNLRTRKFRIRLRVTSERKKK